MKKTIQNIFLVLLTISFVACSNFTDGINDDPNNFTSAPGELLIGQAELATVKLSSSQASRLAGMWTDQFTGSDRQFITLNSYNTSSADFNDDWDDLYIWGLQQADLTITDATATGNTILLGIAQIIKGHLLAEAAALWGDVPYTEALDYLNFPNPNYDSQQSVLDAAQGLLSDGISNVGNAGIASPISTKIFVANDATWAEIAHSLKARYYLVAKNYPQALIEARLGISSSSGDLLSVHGTETGSKNMYYQFTVEQREGYLDANGSHLNNLVTGVTPRLLATPGDAQRAAVYFDGNDLNTSTGGFFAIDASFPIVSYIETKLIEAEAEYRTSGDAATPFNAVRDELATIYGSGFPQTTSTGNALLLEILEEKYISLIGSLQVFHDVRRTENAIGVPIKNSTATKIPQRFLYPQGEVSNNANFPGVVGLFTETPVNQ